MFQDLINTSGSFLREHSSTLCYAWTASLLVIYGNRIVKFLRNLVKSWHYVLRLIFFVLACGFGFGLVTVYISKLLHSQVPALSNLQLVIAMLVAFLILGIFAEKNKVL